MKALLLLLLSFTCIHLVGAQVTQPSYNWAVDYLNCKAIGLSLKGNTNEQAFKSKCSCEAPNYDCIKSSLQGKTDLVKTNNLANEIDGLKNKYHNTWSTDSILSFLSKEIFADSINYPSLFAFAKKRSNESFEVFKNDLKKDLTGKLVPATTAANIQQPDDNNEEFSQKTDEQGISAAPLPIETWQVIFVSVVISLIISGIGLYMTLKKSLSRAKELDARINRYQRRIEDLENRHPGDNKNQYGDIMKRINDLEALTKRLKEDQVQTIAAPILPEAVISKEVPQEVEVKKEHFYLSTPNANGSFNDSSTSAIYKEGASIYKFTKESFNRATFCIDEREASVKLALQYPDKNIAPACEALNAYNAKATRIKTREAGVAELKGDKWVVNTKAKISYEG